MKSYRLASRLVKYCIFLLASILLILSCVFFAQFSQNISLVQVNYLVGQVSLQLNVVMAICLIVGVSFGLLTFLVSYLSLKLEIRKLNSLLRAKQNELNSLDILSLQPKL